MRVKTKCPGPPSSPRPYPTQDDGFVRATTPLTPESLADVKIQEDFTISESDVEIPDRDESPEIETEMLMSSAIHILGIPSESVVVDEWFVPAEYPGTLAYARFRYCVEEDDMMKLFAFAARTLKNHKLSRYIVQKYIDYQRRIKPTSSNEECMFTIVASYGDAISFTILLANDPDMSNEIISPERLSGLVIQIIRNNPDVMPQIIAAILEVFTADNPDYLRELTCYLMAAVTDRRTFSKIVVHLPRTLVIDNLFPRHEEGCLLFLLESSTLPASPRFLMLAIEQKRYEVVALMLRDRSLRRRVERNRGYWFGVCAVNRYHRDLF
jgi:hypothetical protein